MAEETQFNAVNEEFKRALRGRNMMPLTCQEYSTQAAPIALRSGQSLQDRGEMVRNIVMSPHFRPSIQRMISGKTNDGWGSAV